MDARWRRDQPGTGTLPDVGRCARRLSLDGFPDGRDFNFPPPDFATTPENSTHVYFKDIILPASDEVRSYWRGCVLYR